jgi:hypothetical protein
MKSRAEPHPISSRCAWRSIAPCHDPPTLDLDTRSPTLDPEDWTETRALGHRMLDDMLDYLEQIRSRPAWQPIPDEVREQFHAGLPAARRRWQAVYREFTQLILPYSSGNVHPAFMGWVQGGGTVTGMFAEMLAGGLNANLGGRDHIPIEVERQIAEWMRRIFGFPEGASGIFVTGTSIANFMALLIARNATLGPAVRQMWNRFLRQAAGSVHLVRRARLYRQGHGDVRSRQRDAAQHPDGRKAPHSNL